MVRIGQENSLSGTRNQTKPTTSRFIPEGSLPSSRAPVRLSGRNEIADWQDPPGVGESVRENWMVHGVKVEALAVNVYEIATTFLREPGHQAVFAAKVIIASNTTQVACTRNVDTRHIAGVYGELRFEAITFKN